MGNLKNLWTYLGSYLPQGMKWREAGPGESPPDPLLPTLGIALLKVVLCIMMWLYFRESLETPLGEKAVGNGQTKEVEWGGDIDTLSCSPGSHTSASLSEFGPRFTIPQSLCDSKAGYDMVRHPCYHQQANLYFSRWGLQNGHMLVKMQIPELHPDLLNQN